MGSSRRQRGVPPINQARCLESARQWFQHDFARTPRRSQDLRHASWGRPEGWRRRLHRVVALVRAPKLEFECERFEAHPHRRQRTPRFQENHAACRATSCEASGPSPMAITPLGVFLLRECETLGNYTTQAQAVQSWVGRARLVRNSVTAAVSACAASASHFTRITSHQSSVEPRSLGM